MEVEGHETLDQSSCLLWQYLLVYMVCVGLDVKEIAASYLPILHGFSFVCHWIKLQKITEYGKLG